jgi:hypothetical protein
MGVAVGTTTYVAGLRRIIVLTGTAGKLYTPRLEIGRQGTGYEQRR